MTSRGKNSQNLSRWEIWGIVAIVLGIIVLGMAISVAVIIAIERNLAQDSVNMRYEISRATADYEMKKALIPFCESYHKWEELAHDSVEGMKKFCP